MCTRRSSGEKKWLKGLKGRNIRNTRAIRQVSGGDSKKADAARRPCVPSNGYPPISNPFSADEHMSADSMTAPMKEKEGRREREGRPGVTLTSQSLTADGGRLG